jgi:hypothetical protein
MESNKPSRVVLMLGIGPDPEPPRKRLSEAASSKDCKPSQSILARMWNGIYQETLVSRPSLTEQEIDEFAPSSNPSGTASFRSSSQYCHELSTMTVLRPRTVGLPTPLLSRRL